ncbi:zinc carboxypeptidase [Stomoxys calcitrans]|uniref:zinc carboxypeptidase n=1 Tax=Stomoxys calcitrans TaxID=35570 RepID=UPI0027E2503F|nr:zinc carboxypeptidase [Stomoxys calcitrans]
MARYDDFKVYKVFVKDMQQLNHLKKFRETLPVRHLNELTGIENYYDIAIDPANQQKLEEHLNYFEMDYRITIPDLQKVIEDSLPRTRSSGMEWTQYHMLDDIYDFVDNLTQSHASIITPYTIGYSYENRPIKAIKISHKPNNKAIFIDSQIHGIEWITSAVSTCFFNKLLNSQDNTLRHMLMNYDWIYVPVVNPDGFVYTHTVERLWRKNRRPTGFSNSSGICYDIDLYRNFGYEWGAGSSWNFHEPCDHWYGGAKPDTEPEVLALQAFIKSFPDDYIEMYIPLHSYGNFVLLPYGHTIDYFPPNYKQMERIGKGFADAARVKYGTDFKYGATGVLNHSGFVSGSAKDWVYAMKNVSYCGSIEMRDHGEYGFFLPPNQIVEVCAEVTDGLIGMLKAAEKENLFERNSASGVSASLRMTVMMVFCFTTILDLLLAIKKITRNEKHFSFSPPQNL